MCWSESLVVPKSMVIPWEGHWSVAELGPRRRFQTAPRVESNSVAGFPVTCRSDPALLGERRTGAELLRRSLGLTAAGTAVEEPKYLELAGALGSSVDIRHWNGWIAGRLGRGYPGRLMF